MNPRNRNVLEWLSVLIGVSTRLNLSKLAENIVWNLFVDPENFIIIIIQGFQSSPDMGTRSEQTCSLWTKGNNIIVDPGSVDVALFVYKKVPFV